MPVEEWQRKTEQVKLRLPRELLEQLRKRAEAEEMTVQEYLIRLARQDMQIV